MAPCRAQDPFTEPLHFSECNFYQLVNRNFFKNISSRPEVYSEKEKEKIINGLQNEVSFLKERIDLLEKKSDDSEQYSRRNCLLVHGVEEQEQENTDNIILS